jgi:DNA-binding transcriptional MerR regulator
VFKIGDFSKLSQLTVKALRYYDELGLLKPVSVDRFTGYRYYSADQLPRLNRILALKDLGLSLEHIAMLLNDNLSAEQIRGMLRLKQVEVQEHVQEEQARLARVEARLRQIEQEGKMPTNEVVLKKVEPLRVAAVRGIVPSYPQQDMLWRELDAYLARHKVNPVGPCLTVYHDTEYRERDVDVEVCEPVVGSPPSEGRVKVYDLPALEKAACILHHGDFSNVGATYDALIKWIETNGYRIVGSNREVYLLAVPYPVTDVQYPAQFLTDKDANRVTEIQFPVEKT